MIFIKLLRVLAFVLVFGLIYNLLRLAARAGTADRTRRQNGKTRRKYVESSVIEKKDEPPEQEKS